VISSGLVVVLVTILVGNLPGAQTTLAGTPLVDIVEVASYETGLYQDWGIFSPNPQQLVVYLEGHINYPDGTSSVWQLPSRSGLGEYVDFRWREFGNCLRPDDWSWRPLAEYVAHQAQRANGRPPMQVSLVCRVSEVRPPGRVPDRGPWQQTEVFSYAPPSHP